ncbi:UvrD/REP helicase [Rubripirellula lacrimiformis]|uniref:DNA 3'-5' helicase II n=1 Tax=Rubripirellula lacrimiformis TaxID=1930273 RepID=A0A517NB50_9BACT|nr:UvrD-helicase domain-containing protein [Rubripirellula lacrimiformis]QDT04248.1 UvrD/REP helicase [Rubripirellula lacrimiformis]
MTDGISETIRRFQHAGETGQPALRHQCSQLFVSLDRDHHIRILLILDGSIPNVIEQCGAFGTQIESMLADSLDELETLIGSTGVDAELDAFVLLPGVDSTDSESLKGLLPIDQTQFRNNLADFPNTAPDFEALSDVDYATLSSLLFPKREWKRVELVRDQGRMARVERRATLDRLQNEVTSRINPGTTIIEGGPGSGKSLVLVARALWLSEAIENANVLLITWNRSLADALSSWLAKLSGPKQKFSGDNIQTLVFADVLSRHGVDLSLADPSDADHRCRDLLRRLPLEPQYDAILIDEAQDFGGVLIELVEQLVRPGRGGLTLSLDPSQNIRVRPAIDYSARRQPVQFERLNRSYRSTDVIQGFSDFFGCRPSRHFEIKENDDAEPVRLVWAENPHECVEMVVTEMARLISEVNLMPTEIMAVCFSTPGRRQLINALADRGFNTQTPGRLNAAAAAGIQVASPEVAKGHEASCVFVLGWDQADLMDTPEHACRRYVASSRAADILYLVYSSQKIPAEILQGTQVVKQLWPDDFQAVTTNQ